MHGRLIAGFMAMVLITGSAGLAQEAVWESYFEAARVALASGDHSKAERLYRLACKEAESIDPDGWQMGDSLNGLGLTLYGSGEMDGAEALFERALAIRSSVHGPKDPSVAKVLNHLGLVRWRLDRNREALEAFEQATAIYEAVPNEIGAAQIFLNTSLVHSDLGDLEASAESLRKGREIYDRLIDKDSTDYGEMLFVAAIHYRATGDIRKCMATTDRVIRLFDRHDSTGRLIEALTYRLYIAEDMDDRPAIADLEKRLRDLGVEPR